MSDATPDTIALSDQDRRLVEDLIAEGRFPSAAAAVAHTEDFLRDEKGPPPDEVFETDEQISTRASRAAWAVRLRNSWTMSSANSSKRWFDAAHEPCGLHADR